MNIQDIQSLLNKTGQIITAHTQRPVKMKKGQPEVVKDSIFQCRIGVNYDRISNVVEKRESGELPEENQGLIGREWVQFPILLKSTKTGELYIRCTRIRNNFTPKTSYLINGVEVDKEVVKEGAYSSEFPKVKQDNDVFDIKLSSLLDYK
jgi:hypothetical protein